MRYSGRREGGRGGECSSSSSSGCGGCHWEAKGHLLIICGRVVLLEREGARGGGGGEGMG